MNRTLTSAALCVLLITCKGSTDIAGFYVLQAVDGVQIPRIVSATVFCDELILAGQLDLAGNGGFDLSLVQSQDCTRQGGIVDTFTTALTGTFSHDRTQLTLHVAQSDSQFTGTSSGGVVDLRLPQLPLIGGGPHSGKFIIFPL